MPPVSLKAMILQVKKIVIQEMLSYKNPVILILSMNSWTIFFSAPPDMSRNLDQPSK